MSHATLSLSQAAAHVHIDANELRHFAQRGEIEATQRGDEWFFNHRALDEWAQRNLLAAGGKELAERHKLMVDRERRSGGGVPVAVADLFCAESVELDIAAKAKAGILRDMTEVADRSGRVYDVDGLFKELMAREEVASTAIGEGVALLHPRFHDPYMFESSFIAYGRSRRAIFFGAPDGEGTRHFFLICSTDHEAHLRILARLAVLAHGSGLLERLDAAADADAVIAAVRECEAAYL